jgi:NAD-dependent deacetylase
MEPILFITGAGASVDSGLGTYRGEGGLYESEGNPADDLSIDTWRENPEKTWKTLNPLIKSIKSNKPGPTYEIIKKIAKEKRVHIWTQNVDGYSFYTGAAVWEMHGNVRLMKCEICNFELPLNEDKPFCSKCNCLCKPNIVFYGEDIRERQYLLSDRFKTVIVIGTSLQFPYLLNLITDYSYNARVIHINPDPDYVKPSSHEWLCMTSENGLKEIF